MIGLASRSPLPQALNDQVWLLQNMKKIFNTMPSIRHELIYPFFHAFWTHALLTEAYRFRTAETYTRQLIESINARSLTGIKQLLAGMSFCLGLTLPTEIDEWLRAESD